MFLYCSKMPDQVIVPGTGRSRELRRASTDAEWRLWKRIRNRQLAGFKFRRQLPIGRYFADFACVEARLVVELDGNVHYDQRVYDARRTETVERCGWYVVRFNSLEVFSDLEGVCRPIVRELELARR